ncbi:MAG: type II secretion system F family protein [Phycisphaeraceae bacterium]|nr:MAG: type II secretion system F family protein [Phycisphaeraceae bacterium]
MTKYSYKARDSKGRSQNGVVEALSESDAFRKLRAEGLTVTDLDISSTLVDTEKVRTRQLSKSVKREDVIAFSSQLSVMLDTGVPLSEALNAFLSQTKGGGVRRIVEIVADRVHSGVSFSASLSEFPRVFPTLMLSLIRASEATGSLGKMLGRVSDYLGAERRTVKQIKGALTYPMMMMSMAIAVTGFLVGWVLPRFARIYESRSATLPTPTRIIMSISDFLTGNWIALVAAAISLGVGGYLFRRTPRGRSWIDWLKIRSPIIGPIFTNFYLSRATRTLGTLLAAGVTLPEAVGIVRGVTTNAHWAKLWDEMDEAMTQGRNIAEVLLESTLVPASVGQMIAAGERTGRLPEVLERVAQVTEHELDEAIRNGTQMIEPLVITFMGVLIGGIAIALLLPIFTMGTVMGG